MTVRATYLALMHRLGWHLAREQQAYRTALRQAMRRAARSQSIPLLREQAMLVAIREVHDDWYGRYPGDPESRILRLVLLHQSIADREGMLP